MQDFTVIQLIQRYSRPLFYGTQQEDKSASKGYGFEFQYNLPSYFYTASNNGCLCKFPYKTTSLTPKFNCTCLLGEEKTYIQTIQARKKSISLIVKC